MDTRPKLKILYSHYGRKDREGWGPIYMRARELAALGHTTTLLTTQMAGYVFPYEREVRDGVVLLSFPDVVPSSMRKGGIGPLSTLLKSLYALSHECHFVHSDSGHRPAAGVPCVVNRFFRASRYISEWTDYFGKGGIQDSLPWWYRATLGRYDTWTEVHHRKKADGVVALSEYTKARAMQNGIEERRILVLHGGADTRGIRSIPDTYNRWKFGLPEDSLTFGFVGMNEGELQDLEPFLRAVNALKNRYKINWFSTDRHLSEKTKSKYKMGEEFREFGWIPCEDYAELLSCADVFILLLQDNAVNRARWPNKLGDYLAAGRPVLANPVGEINPYIRRFPESFIAVDWTKESIENTIVNLIPKREQLVAEGMASRRIAEHHLSWTIQAKHLESFYYHLLGLNSDKTESDSSAAFQKNRQSTSIPVAPCSSSQPTTTKVFR